MTGPNQLILLIVLIILLAGIGPWWGYSTSWGYYPFGGLLFIILVVFLLMRL